MSNYLVEYDANPDISCNMRNIVRHRTSGKVLYRGPEWAARHRASAWDAGRSVAEEKAVEARAVALARVLKVGG